MDYTGIEPRRRGRYFKEPWEEQYKKKLIKAEEAVKFVQDNDSLSVTGYAGFPHAFDLALGNRLIAENLHIKIFAAFFLCQAQLIRPEMKEHVLLYNHFFGPERSIAKNGNLDFVSAHLGQTGQVITSSKPRITVIGCSPPNEDGWMSRSLLAHHTTREQFEAPNVEILIIEINKQLPFCKSAGEHHTLLHVSEADYIIESDIPYAEIKTPAATEEEIKIGNYVSEIVRDGDCLQVGIGGLADVITENLKNSGVKDLGSHTELMTTGLAKLTNLGIINNSRKTLFKGKNVVTAFFGDKELWEYAKKDDNYLLLEADYVNDPRVICQNDNMLSINNCLDIDLMGQVNSETVGFKQFSGTGGQLQFVVGSQWSKGGRSVIALNSTYKDKEGELKSKIMLTLAPGSAVTTPRHCVNYIVTEFGIVDLKFKTLRERAKLLISIAHPQFRDELTFQAKKCGYLF